MKDVMTLQYINKLFKRYLDFLIKILLFLSILILK